MTQTNITQWEPHRPSLIRHTQAADQQAFDTLYENMQKMVEVARRGVRDGEPGHAAALQKVIEIGKSIT